MSNNLILLRLCFQNTLGNQILEKKIILTHIKKYIFDQSFPIFPEIFTTRHKDISTSQVAARLVKNRKFTYHLKSTLIFDDSDIIARSAFPYPEIDIDS